MSPAVAVSVEPTVVGSVSGAVIVGRGHPSVSAMSPVVAVSVVPTVVGSVSGAVIVGVPVAAVLAGRLR